MEMEDRMDGNANTVELAMPQTQSSVYISKSSFRLTYSLKMARGIFGADVLTMIKFSRFCV